MEKKYVLAMYDVRGIQDYIFRTPRLKDAVGASALVESIISDALHEAVGKEGITAYDLEWYDESGVLSFNMKQFVNDVQVLYIGGGNAYVLYKDRSCAVRVSERMARYVLDKTYSLQLATAIVDKTEDYHRDYVNLHDEMTRIKERMPFTKPFGALPVMKTEGTTGLPVVRNGKSTESLIKTAEGDRVRNVFSEAEKKLDSYVTEKGSDSMLAVVHIDGNNMGRRIRQMIENITDYDEAVNRMRSISYSINNSYKQVLDAVCSEYNRSAKNFAVMKVLAAGDDITYVCNANIAFETVWKFCNKISDKSMVPEMKDDLNYRFSVCAGISFFHSHFPFRIAYDVAEACCESAKSRAKKAQNRDGERIGNWVDFQFCRNVQSRNLSYVRKNEYSTANGENLLRRPLFIPVSGLEGEGTFKKLKEEQVSYDRWIDDMKSYVLDTKKNIPRSYVKDLRNTYPLGEEQVELLCAFLRSRDRKLPEKMYYQDEDGKKTALLYDALEAADLFLETVAEKGGKDEAIQDPNRTAQ